MQDERLVELAEQINALSDRDQAAVLQQVQGMTARALKGGVVKYVKKLSVIPPGVESRRRRRRRRGRPVQEPDYIR